LKKFSTIDEVLPEIKKTDSLIRTLLEKDEYEVILGLMKDRLTLISELTRIRTISGITERQKSELDEIFDGAENIMDKVKSKQKKIKERLDKGKKVSVSNKKISYK
jgi:hypothetical protein